MNLFDLTNRSEIPVPWAEGDNIPWNDPEFSKRMLREHLTQDHNRASRRTGRINAHVDWISNHVLDGQATRILDLGCGPGLYSNRLSRLGHECVGIDYSPASIAYATDQAQEDGLNSTFIHEDIRKADYGEGYGLAMLIFGEFNVFKPEAAKLILGKMHKALNQYGLLLLEPHAFGAIRGTGQEGLTWYTSQSDLFSDEPHLCLKESFWDASAKAMTIRYFIVDAATGNVTRYAQSMQAYSDSEYRAVLSECGFGDVQFYPSLAGTEGEPHPGLMAIVARKTT